MHEVARANPRVGTQIMKGRIKDPLYKEALGWKKMQYVKYAYNQKIVLHYFYNVRTKAISQLKVIR